VTKRFLRHRAGWGANEVKKALSEGSKVTLAQTWRGTLADERRIPGNHRMLDRSTAPASATCGACAHC